MKGIFCDLFSGSVAVARHFKSNDFYLEGGDVKHLFKYSSTNEINIKLTVIPLLIPLFHI